MPIVRLAKIVMCFSLAAFCLLVAFNNIDDYGSNWLLVKHVLAMDTTFPGNQLMYRAITNESVARAAYALIIIAEAVAGALYLLGAIHLTRAFRGPAAAFNEAKTYAVAGSAVAFLLWFFGFLVIGGEWFVMWQSQTWNGQEAAFRFVMVVLAVLIFLVLPDGEFAEVRPKRRPARPKPKL